MTFRPPVPEKLFIDGPAGRLEALVEDPGAPAPRAVAVVCHPHPLFQGTMNNKVVHTTARAINELGLPTVRFNFRGVGASEGTYDDAVGETDDAIAIADYARARWPGAGLWAAGFSFGSYVAFRLALARPVERLVTIAPPVQRFDFSSLAVPACPWLVVQGDADELVNHEVVLDWTRRLVPPPTVIVMPGAEHFFHGRLAELKGVLQAFLR